MNFKTLIVVVLSGLSTMSFASESLMKSKGCMSCHQVERRVVGPSWKDIAKVYATEKGAKQRFETSLKGSKGKWGAVPMPPQPAVNSEDVSVMFDWISKQK